MRKAIALCALLAAASADAAIPESQRSALLAIYQSTNGPSWTNKTNWLGAPGTECTWYGVVCDAEEANVAHLALFDNNLQGAIPATIRNLPKLESIQLWQNNLTGPIPPEIGELSELQLLYAQNNNLTSIPAQIGALKKFTDLGLDGNTITSLPREIGDASALEEIGLGSNEITGKIPTELAKLRNLQVLELSTNHFNGEIPRELGTLSNLQILGLGDNELTGNIPKELGDLASLETLRLPSNQLERTIPPELGNLKNLEYLDLGNNRLTGNIPKELGDLAALTTLSLRSNRLEGTLPTELSRLRQLRELHLGDNALTGPLSPDFRLLTNLEVLGLYANKFQGEIPAELSELSALRELKLQSNQFEGSIPPELGKLTKLVLFEVADNKLTGQIPPQLGSLSNLEVFSVYANQLDGPIPRELGQLKNLTTLYLADNFLDGFIPDDLRNLTKLQHFHIAGNQLEGSLPSWLGELKALHDFFAGYNLFTGSIPESVGALENLEYFSVEYNAIGGTLPDFSRLKTLTYFTVQYNQIGGSLPSSIGALANLTYADFAENLLTGPLPREIGNWANVEYVSFANNSLEGSIPPEIAGLKQAYALGLSGNRFSGTIPSRIGELTELQYLDLSFNALRGPIPPEIRNLKNLENRRSDFSYNALFTSDAATRAFLNQKQYDEDFEATQTVTPADVQVTAASDRSVTLRWTPIRYTYDPGGYQVAVFTSQSGPPVAVATTNSKDLDTITIRRLNPTTNYFFTVSTVTHPHDGQENLLVSDPSGVRTATTGPRIIAPADVVVTVPPEGMVQVDGKAVVEDSFTLTNFGDAATALTLERGGDFFTISPQQFSLAGGESKVVTLKSIPQPPDSYWGNVVINGEGATDLYVDVVLLSVAKPNGTVIAEALEPLVEIVGTPGTDSVGVIEFRNDGTATLRGIVVSDEPWLVPNPEPITIEPGFVGRVNFRIVRSRRPDVEGALAANLSLVYVDGSAIGAFDLRKLGSTTSGVSVSKVSVVDVSKPPVGPGTIPPLGSGEVPLIIAGIVHRGSVRADVAVLNSAIGNAINDLKLYFTSGTATTVATLLPLGATQTASFTNIVGNIYNATNTVGTLHVRSADWEKIGADAKVTTILPAGTMSGGVPVFRGDRAVATGQRTYLPGLTRPGDLIVQETNGVATTVRIQFYDANGNAGPSVDQAVAARGLLELRNTVPAGAVTAVVTNLGASSSILAYARANDASGDSWSVVDWSRFYDYARDEAVRVPFADGRPAGGGKRRAVTHAVAATAPRPRTDVMLFNPTSSDARARLQTIDTAGNITEREITIPRLATTTVTGAGSNASTTTAHLVITPLSGELSVTARTFTTAAVGTVGTAIPIVAATSGLRLGQSQIFSALEDSTSSTVSAATPATFRTSYGFVETSGASVRVRATILIDEAHELVTATTSRTFDLSARQQIFLPELLRSFAGELRDASYGDLHDVTLEIEVIEGSGSIVPFIVVTDNGTGDSVMRVP